MSCHRLPGKLGQPNGNIHRNDRIKVGGLSTISWPPTTKSGGQLTPLTTHDRRLWPTVRMHGRKWGKQCYLPFVHGCSAAENIIHQSSCARTVENGQIMLLVARARARLYWPVLLIMCTYGAVCTVYDIRMLINYRACSINLVSGSRETVANLFFHRWKFMTGLILYAVD